MNSNFSSAVHQHLLFCLFPWLFSFPFIVVPCSYSFVLSIYLFFISFIRASAENADWDKFCPIPSKLRKITKFIRIVLIDHSLYVYVGDKQNDRFLQNGAAKMFFWKIPSNIFWHFCGANWNSLTTPPFFVCISYTM